MLVGPTNIQIDDLLDETEPLNAQENLQLKIAKATFIKILGDNFPELYSLFVRAFRNYTRWIKFFAVLSIQDDTLPSEDNGNLT